MANQSVLITGMTSQQCSPKAARRAESFSYTMREILISAGYEVTMTPPLIDWTEAQLSHFDSIIVGIAPVTSVTANFAYGALATIKKMQNIPRSMMFFDSPEPWKIFASLRSIEKDESKLFKQFYSKRQSFSRVCVQGTDRQHVVGGVERLLTSNWPKTLYPALPWSNNELPGVPESEHKSFIQVMIDSRRIVSHGSYNTQREHRWIVENETSKWTKNTVKSLQCCSTTLRELKVRDAAGSVDAIQKSIGIVIGPHGDRTTWWSPRYSQALSAATPIATDWRSSIKAGPAWSHLAASIEDMSHLDRYELSINQKIDYLNMIPSAADVAEYVQTIVRDK